MTDEPKSRWEWIAEEMRALGATKPDPILEAHDRAPGGCDGTCMAGPDEPRRVILNPEAAIAALKEMVRKSRVMN